MAETPGAGQTNPDDVYLAPPAIGEGYDDDMFREPPKWPKVVGVISIVWGSLGLCCNALSLGSGAIMGKLLSSAASNMQGGMPPVITHPPALSLVAGGIGALWSVFLIVAGATTASRRPVGRAMHIAWAIGGLMLMVLGLYVQMKVQNEIAAWMQANPDAMFTQQQQKAGAIGKVIGFAVAIVFGLAWPVFTLVWFGLVKRKPDDLTGGIVEPAA